MYGLPLNSKNMTKSCSVLVPPSRNRKTMRKMSLNFPACTWTRDASKEGSLSAEPAPFTGILRRSSARSFTSPA